MKGPTLCFGNMVEDKILKVGEELWRETLPLHGGSCFYQLQGLKPYTWYEVKISYPASIPASFSLQLKRDKSDLALNNNRRLLNTEKIIFKTDSDQDETHLILVTVEPEGFPAKQHVPERQFIIFNIEYSSTDSSITKISFNANFPCSIVHLLIHQCAMNCC
ncbi:unnamed protein product [Trifolium pratense]|uniref:Uncharacterized protein n=1 Tax=Trifolium pratense TaxID=57577 RepID=A0ACB0KZF1_TRIPR|nr:unnamed protein product [Trifolium pratense]